MVTLAKLSENDKRFILALLFILILLFVLVGCIGILVKKILKQQASKMDDLLHDVVKTGVIKSERKLRIFGAKKNHRQLFKEAWIPLLIMLVSALIIILYCVIYQNWSLNIFDYEKKEGFGTLIFILDWNNAPKQTFFGIEIVSDWPPCIHYPTWEWHAWGSYLFVPGMLVGGIWFLIAVQAYIARSYRLIKLSKKVFNKSLEDFNANDAAREPIKPE